MEERFGIVVSLQRYSICVRASVETSDLTRPFVGIFKVRNRDETISSTLHIHDTKRSDIRTEAQTQPKLVLPSVADIQCMQNAGHGVVMHSGGGIAAIPRMEHVRAIDVPRASVRDDLMTDGEPMPSLKAAG